MSLPEISVVIPAYRAEKTIARAIQSIRQEARVALEIIVVVDGEFDRTAEVARSFDGVEVLVRAERRGGSFSRNEGLARAAAPFVHFFDADDYVEGDFHGGMVEALRTGGADLVFGPLIEEQVNSLHRHSPRDPEAFKRPGDRDRLLMACTMRGAGGMAGWRTESVRRVGAWNSSLGRAEDIELFVRSLIAGMSFTTSSRGCYVYVQHDGERMTRKPVAPLIASFQLHLGQIERFASTSPMKDELLQFLAGRYYRLSLKCFLEGSDSVGHAMLAEARRLGLRGYPGSILHRIACGVLGLRNKQRLSNLLHRRYSALAAGRATRSIQSN